MAACNFKFPVNESGGALVSKAKDAISKAGGQFNGDDSSGEFTLSTFAGKIVGNYNVTATAFEITVTDKPMFVSCSMIEGELRKFL